MAHLFQRSWTVFSDHFGQTVTVSPSTGEKGAILVYGLRERVSMELRNRYSPVSLAAMVVF